MKTVFVGRKMQIGHGGVGGLFRFLFRKAVPLLKSGAKYFARQGIRTGREILEDVMEGSDRKPAAKKRLNELKRRVGIDAMNKMKKMTGGGGRKRKINDNLHGKKKMKKRKISKSNQLKRKKKRSRRRRRKSRGRGRPPSDNFFCEKGI